MTAGAAICRNVTPNRRRRSNMQKRNSKSPSAAPLLRSSPLPRRNGRSPLDPPRQRGEESAEVQVQQAGGRPWQGWWSHGNVAVDRVLCMSMRRCAPDSSHSSISKTKERGSVGNVAVARVWRTSQTAHVIKHEEKSTSPSGTWQGCGECGCGSSFVHIEGLRGRRSSD